MTCNSFYVHVFVCVNDCGCDAQNEQYYIVTVDCRERHWRLSEMKVKLLKC